MLDKTHRTSCMQVLVDFVCSVCLSCVPCTKVLSPLRRRARVVGYWVQRKGKSGWGSVIRGVDLDGQMWQSSFERVVQNMEYKARGGE